MGLLFPYRETRGTADETAISKGNVDGENATHYTKTPNDVLVGFADAGYVSDLHIVPKLVMYLPIGTQRYLGDQPSKPLWLPPRTTQRSLLYMR